jgi:hypothetical protein
LDEVTCNNQTKETAFTKFSNDTAKTLASEAMETVSTKMGANDMTTNVSTTTTMEKNTMTPSKIDNPSLNKETKKQ